MAADGGDDVVVAVAVDVVGVHLRTAAAEVDGVVRPLGSPVLRLAGCSHQPLRLEQVVLAVAVDVAVAEARA